MGDWNVNGREGTKVADPKQMMGMFIVRERMLEAFESGTMEQGTEFVGQKVSVQIDGGRRRTRSELVAIDPLENFGKTQSEVSGVPSQGRSKEKRRKETFTATWREPKVLKITRLRTNGDIMDSVCKSSLSTLSCESSI